MKHRPNLKKKKAAIMLNLFIKKKEKLVII